MNTTDLKSVVFFCCKYYLLLEIDFSELISETKKI